MYTLLHGFYKYVIQKDEYCVLILGLDNAGKTVSICFNSTSALLIKIYILYYSYTLIYKTSI